MRRQTTIRTASLTMPEVIEFIAGYASAIDASVKTTRRSPAVTASAGGYRVVTDGGDWQCRSVVLASGAHNIPIDAGRRCDTAGVGRHLDREGLPQPGTARCAWRPHRRCISDRSAARR